MASGCNRRFWQWPSFCFKRKIESDNSCQSCPIESARYTRRYRVMIPVTSNLVSLTGAAYLTRWHSVARKRLIAETMELLYWQAD